MEKMMTAKQILINDIEKYIEDNERDFGVLTQGNVISAIESLEEFKTFNYIKCEKIKRKIDQANESQRIVNQKYGWNDNPVHPMDYIAFANDI